MLSGSDSSPVTGAREGTGERDSNDVEGTGLLAEMMRKVDRSFRARLVAGPSDDLGYQYFVEKVKISTVAVPVIVLTRVLVVSASAHVLH